MISLGTKRKDILPNVIFSRDQLGTPRGGRAGPNGIGDVGVKVLDLNHRIRENGADVFRRKLILIREIDGIR
ncbi:MAG: hypothetical protein M3R65_05345 [Gemmatimonadota bacterium]|nr:hypothetical protein [Gemmatimonadota bacterium]